MEKQLKDAIGSNNIKKLQQLLPQLKTNIELEVLGSKLPVTHHVAKWINSLECLKLLIKSLGPSCLSSKDGLGRTAVHLAAYCRDDSWLKLIRDTLKGKDCFLEKDDVGENAVHHAARNTSSNSTLKWLVNEIDSGCLTVRNNNGSTAVFLATVCQSADSLQFMIDKLGSEIFSLMNDKGETLADWVEKDWDTEKKTSKREVLAKQVLQAGARRENQTDSKPLDPNFKAWKFVNEEGEKRLIGEGAFGKVYKAITDKDQVVAVKIIPRGSTPGGQESLRLEMRGISILQKVSHDNIVKFLKYEEHATRGFCVFTELVPGLSLCDLMEQLGQPIAESEVKGFSKQICSAISFLHGQPDGPILHRDINCSNIMLSQNGTIKLIDFGLAFIPSIKISTVLRGTVFFMAPELFVEEGYPVFSVKSDVWSFGCTVYEMTARLPPDFHVGPHAIPLRRAHKREMPKIGETYSENLRDFYLRCVAMEPKDRADVAELLKHKFLSGSF